MSENPLDLLQKQQLKERDFEIRKQISQKYLERAVFVLKDNIPSVYVSIRPQKKKINILSLNLQENKIKKSQSSAVFRLQNSDSIYSNQPTVMKKAVEFNFNSGLQTPHSQNTEQNTNRISTKQLQDQEDFQINGGRLERHRTHQLPQKINLDYQQKEFLPNQKKHSTTIMEPFRNQNSFQINNNSQNDKRSLIKFSSYQSRKNSLGEIAQTPQDGTPIQSGIAIYSSFLNKNKNFHSLYASTSKSNWVSSKTFSQLRNSSQNSFRNTQNTNQKNSHFSHSNNKHLNNSQNGPYRRNRNFNFIPINKQFISEGLNYVQYEGFVRQNEDLQSKVLMQIIDILNEKIYTFRQQTFDKALTRKIFKKIGTSQKARINNDLEQIIKLIDMVSIAVLRGMDPNSIGIGQSPLQKTEFILIEDEFVIEEKREREINRVQNQQNLEYTNEDLNSSQNINESQQRQQTGAANTNKGRDQEKEQQNNQKGEKMKLIKSEDRLKAKREFLLKKKQEIEQEERENMARLNQGEINSKVLNEIVEKKMLQLQEEINKEISQKWLHSMVVDSKEELIAFEENLELLDLEQDYLRDCKAVYTISSQQNIKSQQIKDEECVHLLQVMSQCRILLSQLVEQFKIFISLYDQQYSVKTQSSQPQKTIPNQKESNNLDNSQANDEDAPLQVKNMNKQVLEYQKKQKRIQKLLNEKKPNQTDGDQDYLAKNTKQVILNNRLEQEKNLMLESQKKGFSLNQFICDNRKKVKLERLLNPFKEYEKEMKKKKNN